MPKAQHSQGGQSDAYGKSKTFSPPVISSNWHPEASSLQLWGQNIASVASSY